MSELAVYANKDELARALDWSKPTLDAFLKDNPAAPIERRGSNGVEWQFDVEAFMGFVARLRDAEEAVLKAKRAELDKWALPLGIDAGSAGASSARDIVAQLRANKLAREAGYLVPVSEMRQKAMPVMAKLARFLDGLPRLIGRKHQLPEPVIRSIEQLLNEQRAQLVAEIQGLFADQQELLRDGTN